MTKPDKLESFLQYVGESRGCDPDSLDAAVERGIRRVRQSKQTRAKAGFMHIFRFSAACVIMTALCFAVNLQPFKSAAKNYLSHKGIEMSESSRMLDQYAKDIANKFYEYLEVLLKC